MAEILIHDLHNLAGEAIKTMTHSRSYQIISERQVSGLDTRQTDILLIMEVDIFSIFLTYFNLIDSKLCCQLFFSFFLRGKLRVDEV